MEYDVHLDTFEGPLDLLLHLVRKTDLEVQEIQISEITSEYLSYLEVISNLNLDVAGDFLVMASTLMQIKARMLHPDNEKDSADADFELDQIRVKLLEYQKYKEVSKILSNKEQQYSQTYYRPQPIIAEQDYEIEVTIFDLIKSFQEALRTLPEEVREIMYKEIPIETKIREILDILEGRQYISFNEIMKLQPTRQSLIVSFMAILELVKNKQIMAKQSEVFEEIRIYRVYNDETKNDNDIEFDLQDKKEEEVFEQKPENLQLETDEIVEHKNIDIEEEVNDGN
ncbi:MAG: segregation/condensation protein A [Endomicrobiia bacterium]|nr:segregation/condensation protein A [Endomicrobiaceae bacterium]MDD3922621.1 segregation/condensation protein A [Endomicrobiaceae bacterium]MDD5101954.1 segregation/condensation protein A [Endomicrobiaceae bacterium]